MAILKNKENSGMEEIDHHHQQQQPIKAFIK